MFLLKMKYAQKIKRINRVMLNYKKYMIIFKDYTLIVIEKFNSKYIRIPPMFPLESMLAFATFEKEIISFGKKTISIGVLD